ncbi:MAG: hypothetical protein AAGH71_07155 [Planctomycetota bacterium]
MATRRGAQDIKSYAGRDTSPGSEHKKFIRLSTLEMERVRRRHEYDAAKARADLALARVRALEEEIDEIIAAVHGRSQREERPTSVVHEEHVEVKHTYGVRSAVVPDNPGPERNASRVESNTKDNTA